MDDGLSPPVASFFGSDLHFDLEKGRLASGSPVFLIGCPGAVQAARTT